MKNQNRDEFERKLQQFESNTRENEYSKRILECELYIQKLQHENSMLLEHNDFLQQQVTELRETLANIIPENESLKGQISSMKQLVEQFNLHSTTQSDDKQQVIDQLTAEIAALGRRDDMRKSDMSSLSQLTKVIEEKNQLEDEIQQLKAQRLIDNENYEKKLVKKDQIIKEMNEQYGQVQKGLKQVISSKLTLIKSLQEQSNYLKNELATSKHQLSNTKAQLNQSKQQSTDLSHQVQKLTQKSSQLQTQLQTKLQTNLQQASHYKQEASILKKELQQIVRQSRQFQSENQSLYNQNQQILKQYQTVKQQNMQQKQQLFTVKLDKQSIEQELQQLSEQNKYLVECLEEGRKERQSVHEMANSGTNVSRQIELKQQYLDMLEESRKELSQNQVQLKSTFAQLQGKSSQLQIKQNQIGQLKLSIANHQHYQTYVENANKQLEQSKTILLEKLVAKDQQIKSHENRVEELAREIIKLRAKLQQLQLANTKLQADKDELLKQPTAQQKNSPIEHFYDCNNEKELLHEQLTNTKKFLLQQKHQSETYLSQVHKLKHQLQTVMSSNYAQQTSPHKHSQDYEVRLHQLKEENRLLAEKLNQKTAKLQDKTKKLDKVQSQVKAQFQARVHSLEQQIYRITLQKESNQPQRKPSSSLMPQLQKTDNLLIDYLDSQFELQKANHPQQAIQKQLNSYNQLNSESGKKLLSTEELPKSRQSLSSEDRPYKVMYEELRVQNDSLQAHLQRLSSLVAENKQTLNQRQIELKKLKQRPSASYESEEHLKRIRQLQRQLTQAKQQLQRFESLKQLLKLQKSQSKQKSSQIKQLQQKLSKLQKSHRQLKQDYHNLQTLNQQTNQKYKKTLEQFKKQMNHMNDQIFREKGNIDDKKKQIKRLENQYIAKINLYEDDNMALRSKIKKLQLCNTKLEERVKELEEDQIEKVIITRTQLVNYKQTQKRLQELEDQIHSLLKDKDKFLTEKKAQELYYTEEISLLRNNFSNQREKLLRKITQLEEIKTQLALKLQKTKQILETKRKQVFQLQQNLQRTSKQNYNIKLQLSSALSETNAQLIKNKALGSKIQLLQNQIIDIKLGYEGLVVQKSKHQKDRITKNGVKVQLEMAYKQIQKLNDLLMEKQKQIKHFLTHNPTSDQAYTQLDQYTGGFYEDSQNSFNPHYDANRPRKASREYTYPSENPFAHSESHYKSSKNLYPQQRDFVKEPANHYSRSSYEPRNTLQNPEGYYQRKTPKQEFSQPNDKLIGGFPPKFCTFSPEYHKI